MTVTIISFGSAQIIAEIFYFIKASDMQGADYHWLAILAPGKLAVVNLAFGFWLWYYCKDVGARCGSNDEGELEMILSSVTIFISLMHILFECKLWFLLRKYMFLLDVINRNSRPKTNQVSQQQVVLSPVYTTQVTQQPYSVPITQPMTSHSNNVTTTVPDLPPAYNSVN